MNPWIWAIGTLACAATTHAQNSQATQQQAPVRVEVFVPLCDNALIACGSQLAGNPASLTHNLYWGAMYGAERFVLRKGSGLTLVSRTESPLADAPELLRQTVVRLARSADIRQVEVTLKAYHGGSIDKALHDFLNAARGESTADLVVWMGHDRLMDVAPPKLEKGAKPVPAVVLACESERYFGPVLNALGVPMVAMTRTFMAPEGYLLEALVKVVQSHGVLARAAVREALVAAYARYQKISSRAAGTVFSRID